MSRIIWWDFVLLEQFKWWYCLVACLIKLWWENTVYIAIKNPLRHITMYDVYDEVVINLYTLFFENMFII